MTLTPQEVTDRINHRVKTYIGRTGTPGVAVALHFQGQDYLLPHGYADLEQKTNVTRETILEIGSMTKVFTATLLASQVVHKVIPPLTDADNDAYVRLPSGVGTSGISIKEVTYVQLATHTSGLQDHPGPGRHPSTPLFGGKAPPDDLTTWWIKWTGTPGTCWEYSNIGFVTLGFAVVGPTTSSSYQAYGGLLQDRITHRLGMTSTRAHVSGPNVAQGYHWNKDGPIALKHRASDLKSSAQDILTFLKANLGIYPQQGGPFHDLGEAINMTQAI